MSNLYGDTSNGLNCMYLEGGEEVIVDHA
jgi:hypothetical protein